MSKVVVGMSVSLDGIAGGRTEEEFWPVHEAVLGWVFELSSWRAAQGMDGGRDGVDSQVWQAQFERFGAQVVGRSMFDYGVEAWGETPPFHAPVFVNTTRAGEPIEKLGGTTYTFVTAGIEAAVGAAREAANGADVLVAGGIRTAQMALRAGVVDELLLHVAPAVLEAGARLLDGDATGKLQLRSTEVVPGEGALHLRYDVLR